MCNNNQFFEYLAGIIDGDGSLLLSKQGFGSLEITMDSRDERCLQYIKHQLKQGKIKPWGLGGSTPTAFSRSH